MQGGTRAPLTPNCWTSLVVRFVPTPEKSSRHGGILAPPTPTRNPQSTEVVFVETASKQI